MTSYDEDDYLQLSGIQHFAFCQRQWALSYLEMQWNENVRTFEGRVMHEKVHDPYLVEQRKGVIISRAMPIHSRLMGISGECDIVEFHPFKEGISLYDKEGLYRVVPIEYKRGLPKISDEDILQLSAQAMCLEEMLCCDIPCGYLYYGETRRRTKVDIDNELREKVKTMFKVMHGYYERRYTPCVKWSKSCNACSLKEICLPKLGKLKSVSEYINKKILED